MTQSEEPRSPKPPEPFTGKRATSEPYIPDCCLGTQSCAEAKKAEPVTQPSAPQIAPGKSTVPPAAPTQATTVKSADPVIAAPPVVVAPVVIPVQPTTAAAPAIMAPSVETVPPRKPIQPPPVHASADPSAAANVSAGAVTQPPNLPAVSAGNTGGSSGPQGIPMPQASSQRPPAPHARTTSGARPPAQPTTAAPAATAQAAAPTAAAPATTGPAQQASAVQQPANAGIPPTQTNPKRLHAPGSFRIHRIGDGEVDVAYDDIPDAVTFNGYCSVDPNAMGGLFKKGIPKNQRILNWSGLENGREYFFRIAGVDEHGVEGESNVRQAVPVAPITPPSPSQPSTTPASQPATSQPSTIEQSDKDKIQRLKTPFIWVAGVILAIIVLFLLFVMFREYLPITSGVDDSADSEEIGAPAPRQNTHTTEPEREHGYHFGAPLVAIYESVDGTSERVVNDPIQQQAYRPAPIRVPPPGQAGRAGNTAVSEPAQIILEPGGTYILPIAKGRMVQVPPSDLFQFWPVEAESNLNPRFGDGTAVKFRSLDPHNRVTVNLKYFNSIY